MTNFYGPDYDLHIKIVPHLSTFLSYQCRGRSDFPPSPHRMLAEQPCLSLTITRTTTLSHGVTVNKDRAQSTLTRGRKRAKNLQNHQLNPRAALVCQLKDGMFQSSPQHQDPSGDGSQKWSLFSKAHIYCTVPSGTQMLIARCFMPQDLTLEKLYFPVNGS